MSPKDCYNLLVDKYFGEKCEICKSRDTQRGPWARGYNHRCEQAIADKGLYCRKCCQITWDRSLEDFKASLPKWCEAYGE